MSSKFIHLHTHSHYSLLNALPKIDDLVEAAKKAKMDALALTDNGNMYGTIEFYKKCKEEEIKPIIGVDFYVAVRTRNDRQAGVDNRRFRLILLAKDLKGYKNLIKLVSASYLEGFYYKPRIDKELLEKYSKGLIAISPSFSGEVAFLLKTDDDRGAEDKIAEMKKIFSNDYYLEITHHPEIQGHEKNQEKIKEVAKKTKTPLVAGQDVFYINPEDKKARDTLMSIQTNTDFGDNKRLTDEKEDFSFIDGKKAERYFKDVPEALENTLKIAGECNLELELGNWVFPKIEIPKGSSYDKEFEKMVMEGIKKRGLKNDKELKERIKYELGIIKTKGYSPYFLVVGDLMRFAHEKKILTTIRGSVSGSLVTYLAGITNINPLEYDIPFERFLNPDRPSPPDIDMDFADIRRDEVIEYAREKYGKDNVAQIGTFGTMMARGAVRDTARALGYEYSTGDRIAKLIPFGSQGFPMYIERAMKMTPELAELYKKDDKSREIIDMAKKIEGCARHISVHAAGVVISPEPLIEYVPLQHDPKEKGIITQYDMYSVEEAGLLKFDFLGIKNLTILNDAVRRVKKIYNTQLDIEKIPLDDKKTFEMLSEGKTLGLFQLNGQGMSRFLKELQPKRIHDINAMVALYRPGPMQFIPEYIARKHNPNLISYLDPALEKILKRTYGILVYQDDLLTIARELAGYSWIEVDKFRKAVGKKIPKIMAAQKEKFIKGCIETSGWSKEKAQKIWSWIEPFAAYGFNKAHSVSYGRVAYQTAYMKANYPVEYMAAVLTADAGDTEKIFESINECKRMDISILPPDINESLGDFTVVDDYGKLSTNPKEVISIRFGLYSIKNFGEGIANSIIEEKEKNGKFKSLSDFLDRIHDKNLNKKSLESLIKCGAMDKLGERGELLHNLEGLLAYNREGNGQSKNQDSLFSGMSDKATIPTLKLEETPEASQAEKLLWEKELLGLYISGHPLDKYRKKLEDRKQTITRTKTALYEGMMTVVAGIIDEAKEITTKKGDRMAFLTISDFEDTIEIVAFPDAYRKYKDLLYGEKCVSIKGRVSKRNGETSVIVETVSEL
jgi:DNA polymerase-3 subunit alpha